MESPTDRERLARLIGRKRRTGVQLPRHRPAAVTARQAEARGKSCRLAPIKLYNKRSSSVAVVSGETHLT
jgi:hypothetical protein